MSKLRFWVSISRSEWKGLDFQDVKVKQILCISSVSSSWHGQKELIDPETSVRLVGEGWDWEEMYSPRACASGGNYANTAIHSHISNHCMHKHKTITSTLQITKFQALRKQLRFNQTRSFIYYTFFKSSAHSLVKECCEKGSREFDLILSIIL